MRLKELSFRILNSSLLFLHQRLLRLYDINTPYTTQYVGTSVGFEGSQFYYDLRRFGATGNLDFTQTNENGTRIALFARLTPDDVFYDIGAHGGVFTITAANKVPGLTTVSFEPQPNELLKNLALNEMEDSYVFAVAVGEHAGTVRMTSDKRSSNHLSNTGDIEVDCVRLDDFRCERDLPMPTWVKIDIEGMELPALKGFAETLAVSKPVVICEINHVFSRFGTRLQDLISFFSALGYDILGQTSDGFVQVDSNAGTIEELGQSIDENYWFVPKTKLRFFIP